VASQIYAAAAVQGRWSCGAGRRGEVTWGVGVGASLRRRRERRSAVGKKKMRERREVREVERQEVVAFITTGIHRECLD
jgi:hypothetical protein